MNHKEYYHIIPGAASAVLFIHGILGTPDHFDFLIPHLPRQVSVHNLLLDGHGKGVRDFSRTSMAKWERQVHGAISALKRTHRNIYIAAHSMGTLFALHAAVNDPSVKGLFLLAVPVCPAPKLLMFSNAFKVYTGRIDENDILGTAARAACSIRQTRNPIPYLPWVLRYGELYAKILSTRKILPQLKTHCVTCQSQLDEMVSVRSVSLLRGTGTMEVYALKNSYHYLYSKQDQDFIETLWKKFTEIIE